MKSKHKPCPFCGSEDLNIEPGTCYVTCRSCGTYGPSIKIGPYTMTQRDVQLAIIWDAWDNRGDKKPVTFTPGPWFMRYCDDDSSMCMTVISSKDYGPANTTRFGYADENDTVAIVYHQSFPLVGDDPDVADANARLIAAAPDLLTVVKEISKYPSGIAFGADMEREMKRILKAVGGGL